MSNNDCPLCGTDPFVDDKPKIIRAITLLASESDGAWQDGMDILLAIVGEETVASVLDKFKPVSIETVAGRRAEET